MGKIGQNPQIWQLWRPVALQPYVLQKSWPTSETPWPLDYKWSKQCLAAVHPVTCILLWVRCMFDWLAISGFGGKWPLRNFKNFFQDLSTGHRITFREKNWWKSAVAKLPKGRLDYHTNKKLGLRGTRPSPHFGQNGPIAPKIPWTLSLLDLSTYTEFCPDKLRFAGLIPERLIFRTEKLVQL